MNSFQLIWSRCTLNIDVSANWHNACYTVTKSQQGRLFSHCFSKRTANKHPPVQWSVPGWCRHVTGPTCPTGNTIKVSSTREFEKKKKSSLRAVCFDHLLQQHDAITLAKELHTNSHFTNQCSPLPKLSSLVPAASLPLWTALCQHAHERDAAAISEFNEMKSFAVAGLCFKGAL